MQPVAESTFVCISAACKHQRERSDITFASHTFTLSCPTEGARVRLCMCACVCVCVCVCVCICVSVQFSYLRRETCLSRRGGGVPREWTKGTVLGACGYLPEMLSHGLHPPWIFFTAFILQLKRIARIA